MMYRWLGMIGFLSATPALSTPLPVAATAPSVSTMDWRITAPTNWVGDGRQPVAFLNVATDDTGQIYVANFSGVLLYDAAGTLQGAIVDPSGTVVQYDDVEPVGDGTVWVADSKSFTVYLLDPAGNVLRSIPSNTADHPDAAMRPNELEVGPDGNVYVMYSSASTVMQVFTPEGVFVRSFDMGDSNFSTGLIDFAFGPDGNLYIAGSLSIRVLDPEGNIVVEKFAPDFVTANTAGIRGVAVDTGGNVYIGATSFAADGSLVAAVYQLDAAGQVLAQFGRAQQRADWGTEFQPEELGFTVSLAVLAERQLAISDLNGAYSQLLKVTMTP